MSTTDKIEGTSIGYGQLIAQLTAATAWKNGGNDKRVTPNILAVAHFVTPITQIVGPASAAGSGCE
jgi:hypothetical protein